MSNRYSILGPIKPEEKEFFGLIILDFFSPLKNHYFSEKLGFNNDSTKLEALSLNDLLRFLKEEYKIESLKYLKHLDNIIRRFVNNGYLIPCGNKTGSVPLCNCYVSMYELSTCQKTGVFWLGKVLGPDFLLYKYKDLIVRFEGVNEMG